MRGPVTEIELPSCASAWYGRVAWRSRCALLIGVGATLFFFNLGARVLSTNDEARFPLLARDILVQAHCLLPRLDGIPHLNKPPLHAWLIALAAWPTGAVTPWTACVPSVFAGLAVVGATYWIARRLFDRETALVAGLTVLTTQGVFVFAREPMPDMTFCAALTGALAAYVAAEVEGRRWALVAFYGLIGIAFWTKGPAGLLPLAVVAVDLGVTDGSAGPRRLASAPRRPILCAPDAGRGASPGSGSSSSSSAWPSIPRRACDSTRRPIFATQGAISRRRPASMPSTRRSSSFPSIWSAR